MSPFGAHQVATPQSEDEQEPQDTKGVAAKGIAAKGVAVRPGPWSNHCWEGECRFYTMVWRNRRGDLIRESQVNQASPHGSWTDDMAAYDAVGMWHPLWIPHTIRRG